MPSKDREAKRRAVMPGFPKQFVFQCREDVDAYLAGDRITCLLCGKDYRILETHLRSIHEMTGDEYRARYGLPYGRGLCDAKFSDRKLELNEALITEHRDRQMAAMAKAQANSIGANKRKKPQYWKNERTKYTLDHFEEFVRRIMDGATVEEVSDQDGMPDKTHVYWYMKRDKDFAAKYRAIVPLFRPIGKRKNWREKEKAIDHMIEEGKRWDQTND